MSSKTQYRTEIEDFKKKISTLEGEKRALNRKVDQITVLALHLQNEVKFYKEMDQVQERKKRWWEFWR